VLLEIELAGTQAGDSHPSHIHNGSVSNPGGIAVSLTPVNGATGVSRTNISMTDSGDAFGFNEAENFTGYINIHESMMNLANVLAQGDIGSNI
jgi:hypothetical protein